MNVRPADPAQHDQAGAARLDGAYSLCGTPIDVTATGEAAALLGSRLRFLRSGLAGSGTDGIVFDIRSGDDDGFAARPAGPGRPVYDAPGAQLMYLDGPDQLFVEYPGHLRMLCRPAAGLVQSAVLSAGPGSFLAAYPFFTIPVMEMMKRRGRFPLHAGCVALDGRGVLLAGTSGSGKSTLTAALVRDGWDFLSDDMVFLTRQAGVTSAWGFCDDIDCSDQTAAMFAELRHLIGGPVMPVSGKHPVDVEAAFGVRPVPACQPRALVLPRISGERTSELTAVSGSYALRELVPNVLLTHGPATQAHLDALGDLVREIPCYALATGTDLGSACRLLREVLA